MSCFYYRKMKLFLYLVLRTTIVVLTSNEKQLVAIMGRSFRCCQPIICVQFMQHYLQIFSHYKFCSIALMRCYILILLTLSLFSCKRKWTDKDKADFYSGCLSNATKNKDIKNPKSYCSCLLQKVVAKYPNANDA